MQLRGAWGPRGRRCGMGSCPRGGGSPNLGESQAAVILGAASGAAPRCLRRGSDRARLAGRAGAETAAREGGGEGSPSSLCQEKRRRPAASVSCRAGASPEARAGARVTRPRGRGARPGRGRTHLAAPGSRVPRARASPGAGRNESPGKLPDAHGVPTESSDRFAKAVLASSSSDS